MSDKEQDLIEAPVALEAGETAEAVEALVSGNGGGNGSVNDDGSLSTAGTTEEFTDDRSALAVLGGGVVRVYRVLRSMRTALILLIIVAIASIVGTLIPQQGQQDQAIAEVHQSLPSLSAVADALQLFNIYGSWWFQVVILILLASLLSCVIPRTKAVIKKLRAKQPHVGERFLSNLPNSVRLDVRLSESEALDKAAEALKSQNFRAVRKEGSPNQLFARKGRIGDIGSLMFHYSFVILLVAAVLGKMYGFEGRAFIIEGDRWVEQHLQYDSLTEGKLFAIGDPHKGFEIQVDDFTTTYWGPDRGYMAKDFVTTAKIFDGEKLISEKRIKVNGKLKYKGVKFYQSSYGWAPHLTVSELKKDATGKTVKEVMYDKPSIFFPGQSGSAMDAQGQIQIPENPDPTDPNQIRVDAVFAPDIDLATGRVNSPYVKNPAMIVRLYKGPSNTLIAQEVIRGKGQSVKIGDYEVGMPNIKEWTGLEVNKDPGVPFVYLAFTIMVLGVMIALYISHRRVWVAAVPGESGNTSLIVAGLAEKNKSAFEVEYEELVKEVCSSTGAKDPEFVSRDA